VGRGSNEGIKSNKSSWEKLPRLNIPPKQINFLWRIIHNVILLDSLQPLCPRLDATIKRKHLIMLLWNVNRPLSIKFSNTRSKKKKILIELIINMIIEGGLENM
jgi:ABC-type transport system involved in cytochrome c biogenesis ATPase subunit